VRRFAAAFVALLAVPAGCVHDGSSPPRSTPRYEYALAPPAADSWTLRIEATFAGAPSERLVAPEAADSVGDVSLREDRGARPLARDGDAWIAPACRERCTVTYSVDLQRLSDSCRWFDCTRRVGDAVIGSAIVWMMRPEPMGDALVGVHVAGGDASRFVTGLRRSPQGGYTVRARELGEAAYTAIGSFRRTRVDVGGAGLDVAFLGQPVAMGDAGAIDWVRGAASCVASLYGRFPCDATVFVVPVHGRDGLLFGRVLSLAGASVALLYGDATRADGMHDDWVAVHELFHLSTASFVGEGHWLEEGLATFYEPILRERAGWWTEADLWRHFVEEMPRGVHKDGEPASIEERDDIDSTYWGGALFALLVDVGVLEATRGARSFDDAMRGALRELGDGTHSSSVAAFLAVADRATGTTVPSDVYRTFAMQGGPVDLEGLWRRLGIERKADGAVALHDDAPLAYARKAIAGVGPGH
jgi:predicted metalloprotease with PDZ domain